MKKSTNKEAPPKKIQAKPKTGVIKNSLDTKQYWAVCDIETTGTDPDKHKIIEFALAVVDAETLKDVKKMD